MTTTKGNGTTGIKFALVVLSTAVGIAGAGYGLVSSRVDDKCQTIDAKICNLQSEITRNTGRLDREERSTLEVSDRLARIETKLDQLLERKR